MSEAPTLVVIGRVRSPWPQKFGVPRQSGLTRAVEAQIELDRELIPAEALRGLASVSHVWILSWFDQCTSWRPTVRPPRLGGTARLGVFATRAPHRPNPIGLSLVRLIAVEDRTLRVADLDLLDGTPVLDIKPHLPWAEQPADARCDWAPERPEPLEVRFAPAAAAVLDASEHGAAERAAIVETLRWDPRPAHQRDDPARSFGLAIFELELRFVVDEAGVLVLAITRP
jgi:tRNA-Thr(GGU) m(6)t(6)A37 methyltransferase TsaA